VGREKILAKNVQKVYEKVEFIPGFQKFQKFISDFENFL
jgi:hypothetical protein